MHKYDFFSLLCSNFELLLLITKLFFGIKWSNYIELDAFNAYPHPHPLKEKEWPEWSMSGGCCHPNESTCSNSGTGG